MGMVSKLGCICCIVKPPKAPEEAAWLCSEGSADKVSLKNIQFLPLEEGELRLISPVFSRELQLREGTVSASHDCTSGLTRIMLYFENTAFGSVPGFLKAVWKKTTFSSVWLLSFPKIVTSPKLNSWTIHKCTTRVGGVNWYPCQQKNSPRCMYATAKTGLMQYLLETEIRRTQCEMKAAVGQAREMKVHDELLLKRVAAVGWQVCVVLPAAWQLPRLSDISSSATSPQSQKLLHQLTKTTCNTQRKFQVSNKRWHF